MMVLYNYYTKSDELDLFDPYITDNPSRAYEFASSKKLDRFTEGEAAIARAAQTACRYAQFILKYRFELGEPVIAKSDRWAYEYARYVVEGAWPEGEPAIAKDPEYSLYYAQHVIKGRFELGEPAIDSVRKLYIIYDNFLEMIDHP